MNNEIKKEQKEYVEKQNSIKAVVRVRHLNFRVAPNFDANVIDVLESGTPVEVLEEYDRDWSKIHVNGTIGYCITEYLTFE